MPSLSERGLGMPSSPIRKLAPYATAAEDRGVKIYHLNIGQPDIPTPKKAIDALRKITRTTLEYSPSQGYLSVRQAFSRYYSRYGIDVDPEEIIITAGGSFALLFSFMSCLDPGDEIIVPEPSYANYFSFAKSVGAVVRPVTSTIEDGFALPPVEEFKKLVTPRTKAILICNPNNPTGGLYSPEEMERLRDIVLKHDLFLLSDEVYREFIYDGAPYRSALSLKGVEDNVIVIDSVSKRYSECGIRIGMMVTRNPVLRAVMMKFCQARLSPPLLGQIVAENSVDGTEEYQKEVYEEYVSRRNFLVEGLNKIPGVFTNLPRGAFYTIARLPVDDTEDFCKWCLTDFRYTGVFPGGETVMMAPASGFYATPGLGRNEVRIAYVLNKEDLARALDVLERALGQYLARK
ncbi:MAG: pyridoxal phosphate-dependent aminotransferase [Bacteroidales bacterium]|nr:pyridoxal phosphate-dependent aminotransferase [Bacteroidales bacterium]